jgi:aryl-alcohol dehydrogenase-like predicted oxidoreductase
MHTRRLGQDGPLVSTIGLGFWSIGGAFGPADRAESRRTVARAIDLGVTLFDTAPAYGESEVFLGETLDSRQRNQVFLTTKCGLGPEGPKGRLRLSSRPADLRRHLEGSLHRLRTDWVDLLLIHWPDPTVPVHEAVGALDDIRRAGLARFIGVSNFSAVQLREACSVAPIVCNQVGYHLFDRRWERTMFATAEECGVAIVGYSPLAHGLLSGTLDPATFQEGDWRAHGDTLSSQHLFAGDNLRTNIALAEQMASVARRHGMTLAEASIAWILSHPLVASTITGSRRVARLEENARAAEYHLDSQLWSQLGDLASTASGQEEQIPVWPARA